ncbi:choice-of-anchor X domain-containing protein [Halosimplex amylolyticum]|uniref:choice-of-anchor X domain-containing protein n=1 Tax=Halosimplex amylolyticum TaxID=3396616 RepID=UPI003F57A8DF
MTHVTIPNRPFATEQITGLMLPDGIFETSIGAQNINVHLRNVGNSPTSVNVYIEGASTPALTVSPRTHEVSGLSSGASRQVSWEADFSAVSPGVHHVSFVAENGSDRTRLIKKIFVTRVNFDPNTLTFGAETPEGNMEVQFTDMVEPRDRCCRTPDRDRPEQTRVDGRPDVIEYLQAFEGHEEDFEFCPPGYLPEEMSVGVERTPPYDGKHGDLPFQDPWWKIVLCIIVVVLLIAAAIAASQEGGTVIVGGGGGGGGGAGGDEDCCGVSASGGSSSYLVAGLVAAAAAAATAAVYSDDRDPFRRGQDNTDPSAGEQTTSERLDAEISYGEPIALGRPFAADVKWTYTRQTTGGTYTHSVSETNTNQHVLSRYEIRAPDVVDTGQRDPFVVEAEFFDEDGNQVTGDELFVQCILAGPNGEYERFVLQDDGIDPDQKPDDGVYTGEFDFRRKDARLGMWRYYVVAQDVNSADPDMAPEEAAKIIGGMVVTHQLEITFDPTEECEFVSDGHVNVI